MSQKAKWIFSRLHLERKQAQLQKLSTPASNSILFPKNRRALPEDFVQAVQSLPNPGMVKELILMDEPYYRDVYKAKEDGNSAPAAANASEEGRIVFFEADNTVEKAQYFEKQNS